MPETTHALDAKVIKALGDNPSVLFDLESTHAQSLPPGAQANFADLLGKWGPKILAIIKVLIQSGVLAAP